MSVTGFYHAGVTVSDMDAALRFYRDGLGLELIYDGPASGATAARIWALDPGTVRVVFLGVPGSDAVVELFEFTGIERHSASARPVDYGAGHFCLYTDDAEGLHARMVAAGYRSRSEEVVTIHGGHHDGVKAVYLIDPDGYHVELYQRP
jgi:catechol 2,3-dioxygenase-like lactoylglutathione lyase family enzyme